MSRFHCCTLGAGLLGNGASLPLPCTLIKAWSLPKGGVIPPLGAKGLDSTFLGVTPSDATACHGVLKLLMKRLRSEEHTSELSNLVCRLLLEKKKEDRAHKSRDNS